MMGWKYGRNTFDVLRMIVIFWKARIIPDLENPLWHIYPNLYVNAKGAAHVVLSEVVQVIKRPARSLFYCRRKTINMEKEQVIVRSFMGIDQDNRALLITDDGRMFRTSNVIKYMARAGIIYVETENHIYTDHQTKLLENENELSVKNEQEFCPKL